MAAEEINVPPVLTQPTDLAPPPPGDSQPSPPPQTNQPQPPTPAPQAPEQGGGSAPPRPKRDLKKPLLIAAGIGVAILVIYLIIRLILPLFGGGEKEANLTWWGLWEDQTIVTSVIEEYQTQNPGVTITYIKQSPQDYRERLTNALARGDGPDIFRFHNTWVPMFRAELDPLPPEIMPVAEFDQAFFPVVKSDLTAGTDILGIPLGFDTLALYINEDMFAAAGKTPPTIWDDLRKTALEMTIKDEDGRITTAGVALGRTENVDHWPEILGLMMFQNGADLTNPQGQLAEDALEFFTVFSSTDGVWDETQPPSTVAFANGRLAMYLGPSWRAFEIQELNPQLRFRVVPVPQLPKERPTDPTINYASYWVEGVWQRSENKEAAWNFLKFVSSSDSLQKLYQNASTARGFGEPYPRVDMQGLLSSDPLVGAFVTQGPEARSWYLASRTFDGPTGINSQMIGYFEDAVNAVNQRTPVDRALETAAAGVGQVLSQYGLTR